MYRFKVKARHSRKKWYAFIVPDVHVGYVGNVPTYSPGAWDVAMQALATVRDRITHVIILGDFGNWESLSHWASLTAEGAFVEEDIALVNLRLDEIEGILAATDQPTKVVFCEGNHEAWATQFEAKYPGLRDMVNLQKRLRFPERGWEWVPENHFYRLGDLHFTHGHIRGANNPELLVKLKGVSIMRGHTHARAVGRCVQLDRVLRGYDMGCLASIDPPPPYSRGEIPWRWAHGFGLVQVRANGRFQEQFCEIESESYTELPDGTELLASQKRINARLREDAKTRAAIEEKYRDRYYHPGGNVRGEPTHGKTERTARTRRARKVRGIAPGELLKR